MNTRHLCIPIAVVGELRRQHMRFAIRNVHILRLCAAQIVAVEIALLQHLPRLNADACAARFMHGEPESSGEVLPKVKHFFSSGRVQQRNRANFFLRQHGNAPLIFQRKRFMQQHRVLLQQVRQRIIHLFAIINVGKDNVAPRHLPTVIRANNLFAPIRIAKLQLCNQLPARPVVWHIHLALVNRKPPQIPSAPHQHGNFVLRLQQLCHIIRLHLNPRSIVLQARRQLRLRHCLTIDRRFIQPQSANIQPRLTNFAIRRERLVENRMPFFFRCTGNPLTLPRLLSLPRLKPVRLARCFLARIRANRCRPPIARTGAQRQRNPLAQAVQRCKASIRQHLLPLRIRRNPNRRRRLMFARSIFHLIGENRRIHRKPQRIFKMVHQTIRNLHRSIPSFCHFAAVSMHMNLPFYALS